MPAHHLPRPFYDRPALDVARGLLGKGLVRLEDGRRLGGMIVETEAYRGEEDLACHCRHGRTSRTQVMYGPAGFAYVYFTYGNHWMLNFVVEGEGCPAAILIRAILPEEGLDVIASRRAPMPEKIWTDGPGKLSKALDITGAFNGADLCAPDAVLFVEDGPPIPDRDVTIGPRVGLNNTPEPWKSIPWRFLTHPGPSTFNGKP